MPDSLPSAIQTDWLDAVDLGWQPIVARDLRPIGVRIEAHPDAAATTAPAAELVRAMLAGCCATDGTGFPRGLVLIALRGMALDDSYRSLVTPRNALIEIAASRLADAAAPPLLEQMQRHGLRLALHLDSAVAEALRGLSFQYVVRDLRAPLAAPAGAGVLVSGAACRAQAQAAFDHGAHAVIGWPVNEAAAESNGSLQATQKTVLELIRLLQAEADAPAIERALKAEPMLLYMLLTLANSPAFRRGSNIASVTQAITLLGYKRLLKWLVLLLVIASKGSRALPQIHTAVVRGFFMENIADAMGASEVRDDAFVTGAFSLLDRIVGVDAAALFNAVSLPDAVIAAVVRAQGPVAPLLEAACALETTPEKAASLPISRRSRNVALLQALASADALQSMV